jgi:hypothetical protein
MGLVLSFADDGSRPCDPGSRSPVRQIEVLDRGEEIQTDRGPVVVGQPTSDIPPPIEEAGTRPDQRGSHTPLLEGSSPCDPGTPVPDRRSHPNEREASSPSTSAK